MDLIVNLHRTLASLQWSWLLSSAVLAYFAVLIIYRKYFHPLSNVPGPFWGSVTHWYAVYVFVTGNQYLSQYDLHKKYGPIIRFQPNKLLVSDPLALPTIYHRFVDKPSSWYAPHFGVMTVHSMSSHEEHVKRRKIISSPYSQATVNALEPQVDRITSFWLSHLESEFTNGQTISLSEKIEWFSRDLWAELVFGKRFGFIERDGDIHGQQEMDAIYRFTHQAMAYVPSFSRLIKSNLITRRLLMPPPKDDVGDGYIMAETRRQARSKRPSTEKEERTSVINRFLDLGLPEETLVSEVRVFVGAASGPVATALVEAVLNIIDSPGSLARIFSEINGARDAGKLPTAGPVPYTAIRDNLPYFSACIRETLRGSTVATFMYPRCVSPGGVEVCGYHVPASAQLAAVSWIVQRNKLMYGEDAEEYRPERWLEADESTLREWRKYEFNFGYGSRGCLGKSFALSLVHKIVFEMLCQFEISRPEPYTRVAFTPTKEEAKTLDTVVRLTPRQWL